MLPAILILGAIGIVWCAVILRFGHIMAGCLTLIFVSCCFGYLYFNVKVGPLPLSVDRVVMAGLLLVFGVFRLRGFADPKPLDRGDVLFGLFLGMLTVNMLCHDWKWDNSQPLAKVLFLYGLPGALYWIVRQTPLTEPRLRMAFGFFSAFSVYLALTGMAELLGLQSLVFPRYILDHPMREWIGRARGPFLNPVANAVFMSVGLYSWAMFWPQCGRIGKAICLIGMAIAMAGVFCTLTRSCWIGAAIGMTLIVIASLPVTVRIPAAILSVILAVMLLPVAWKAMASFKRDAAVSVHSMEQSAKMRPLLVVLAWKVFQDNPVFGCGVGQYKRVDVNYWRDPTVEVPLEMVRNYVQHNVLLGLLVETGLVGFLLYCVLWMAWLHRAWRVCNNRSLPLASRQAGLMVVAVFLSWSFNGMFHDVSLMINGNLLMFFLTGISQGLFAAANAPRTNRDFLGNSRVMDWQLGNSSVAAHS